MQLGVIYNLGIQENISGSFNTINQRISAVTQSIGSTKKAVQELAAASFGLNQLKQAFDNLGSGLNAILQPGISLNSSLSDLSALTATFFFIRERRFAYESIMRMLLEELALGLQELKVYHEWIYKSEK